MKKVWLLIGILAGLLAGLVLPVEWRAKLSRPLVDPLEHCLAGMPDD